MGTFFKIMAMAAMAAVAFVLLRGLLNMARAGDGNTSNKLMQARVFLQLIAIILIVLAIYFGRTG